MISIKTKNIHAKRALKILNAISSYLFEEECYLEKGERDILNQSNAVLTRIIKKYKDEK